MHQDREKIVDHEDANRNRSTATASSLDVESAPQTKPERPAQDPEDASHRPIEPEPEPEPEPVQRSERRGLLTSFLVIPEVKNPHYYGSSTKWLMTTIVALAGTTSSTGSSIFYPALRDVAADLDTTQVVTNLSLAFYLLAMAITPLWWSMYSELIGRRTIYLVSFFFFVVFSVICAVSRNIAMLIVFRVLSGGAAASVQAVGAGTIADLFEPRQRGKAMGIFFLGPLCGPGIAPIIGGALTERFGWQSTQYFLAIFGGVLWLLILFFLPETVKAKHPSSNEQTPKPKLTLGEFLKRCVRPLKTLGLLRHPPIFVAIYSGALAFAVTYVVYISIQSDFPIAPYHFTDVEVGLVYLAPTIGYAISSILGGRWHDSIMAREAKKAGRYGPDGKLKYLPEDRLKENVWIATILYPGTVLWFGWTLQKGIHWAVPAVASLVYGIFSMLLYGAVTTVLTEFTPNRSSSGIALNNFTRQILATIATVVTQPLIEAIGTGYLTVLVGLFALVTTLAALLALRIRGPQWRVQMERKFVVSQD
ncbi:major facilitator superfamily transporter [Nemania sp. FL0916]|nr:major facilitator superfamily transporter [Nemania sp. FL0916]